MNNRYEGEILYSLKNPTLRRLAMVVFQKGIKNALLIDIFMSIFFYDPVSLQASGDVVPSACIYSL